MDITNANLFEATGKGYYNKLPVRPEPTPNNATAVLINNMVDKNGSDKFIQPLWIYEISTSYKLGVSYGQGPQGRTTYPHNLAQGNIILNGVCATQFQYDQIVEFCTKANHNILNYRDPSGPQTGKPSITLNLYNYFYGQFSWNLQKEQKQGSQEYDGWLYDVAVESIEAGHERYKNARLYTIQCTVLYDYLQTRTEVDDDIYKSLIQDYLKGLLPFGLVGAPTRPTHDVSVDPNAERTVERPDVNSPLWIIDPNNPFNSGGFPGT